MVIVLILLILFHHRDTIPEVYLILFNLTLYLKLPYWMRNSFCLQVLYIYMSCKPRYLVKLHNVTLLITFI